MSAPKGLQILHESDGNVTIGALAAFSAIALTTAYAGTNITRGFLMKKMQGSITIEGLASGAANDDIPLLFLCYGDTSAAEAAAAAITEQPDASVDTLIDQATVRRIAGVLAPTMIIQNENDANPADVTIVFDLSKMDLPSKGMPFAEGQGWNFQLFNPTAAAFTTGGVGHTWARYFGVWLSD